MESAGVMRSPGYTEGGHQWQQVDYQKGSVSLDVLPLDPRNWSRTDVAGWLGAMESRHRIVDLKKERFQMNGKALCLMTVDMYLDRVPVGGKLLYKDFQIRLARAMYL